MEYGWIFEKSIKIKDEIIAWRRDIHALAEVGFETEKTKEYIYSELVKIGLSPRYLGGGIVCEIVGTGQPCHPLTNIDEKSGVEVTEKMKNIPKKRTPSLTFRLEDPLSNKKCVLLRADIDALPIYEETDCGFRATNGNMHACGHDMHASSLIGAAKLLNEGKNRFCGTVKLVFQSAEEILSGAKEMIASGVMENPRVDFSAALHVVVGTELETGTLIIPNGEMSAPYADFFKIEIRGTGGHGASPQKSKNAAICGAAIAVGISKLATNGQANEFSVSVCQIESGNAPNVIPEKCVMRGNLRALSHEARSGVINEINEICRATSKAHGCTAEFEITSSTCALFCNENLSKSAEECLKSAYKSLPKQSGATVLKAQKAKLKASTPSEDFAEFAEKVPSVLVGICAGKPSNGFSFPLHSPQVTFDEEALPFATTAYTALAFEFLHNASANTLAPKNKQDTGF